jgi:hypothetical protein
VAEQCTGGLGLFPTSLLPGGAERVPFTAPREPAHPPGPTLLSYDSVRMEFHPGTPDPENRLPHPEVMEFRVSSQPVDDPFILPATLSSSYRRLAHDRLPPAHQHWVVAMVEYPDGMLTFHELARVPDGEAAAGEALLTIADEQGKTVRWWFDWNRELLRFANRVTAYLALMDDRYPSTDEEQSVHLDFPYPDVPLVLNRWLPLVKWLLAIPHYVVLFFLDIATVVVVIVAWFAILFTGRYPRSLFNFVEGVIRWHNRVVSYAFILVTDRYPPFQLGV